MADLAKIKARAAQFDGNHHSEMGAAQECAAALLGGVLTVLERVEKLLARMADTANAPAARPTIPSINHPSDPAGTNRPAGTSSKRKRRS